MPSYAVFDDRTAGAFPAYVIPGVASEAHLTAGTWVRADTLADLARLAGLPADALVASVERFNAFAAAGRDEDFGRGDDEFDRHFADPVLCPSTSRRTSRRGWCSPTWAPRAAW